MAANKEQVTQQLRKVILPAGGQDIVTAGLIRNVAACDGVVSVRLALPAEANPARDQLRAEIEAAVRELDPETKQVAVEFVADAPQEAAQSPQDAARQANPLPNVKHIVAVGAGKGGVGKSTIAVNLAVGLARLGRSVGLLDGDIYGPSVPTMLGLHEHSAAGTSQLLRPFFVHGIKTMTIGKLVEPDKALVWRGPMAHGAFQQLALQTDWGELDYLVVDLPPGTGDVPLTLAQVMPLTGAIIVCTPQLVAQDDAVRAAKMFPQLGIPVLGVVENMSYFIGDDGKEYDIFGKGGAATMAQNLGLPLLGQVPINTALRANGDAGDPRRNFEGDDQLATELMAFCKAMEAEVDKAGASQPTLSIS